MDKSILEIMPHMLTGKDLDKALGVFPPYDETVCQKPVTERLIALQDLYNVYFPDFMSREIYTKLYLSLLRSLQKKQTTIAIRQYSENARLIRQQSYESIIGGADAVTIIAPSGRGKSSAISRAIAVLTTTPIIEFNGTKLISCLTVQCPADTSIKGLLLETLRRIDELLDSEYYSNAIRAKSTVDVLIGSVSQVALKHLGVLIIDEIQNVVNKHGQAIIGTLTQLINCSGISIVMVGTPECETFFSSSMIMARRSTGLSYSNMEYDEVYREFVGNLLRYNYTITPTNADEPLCKWLYNHSDGNLAITSQLIHDAEEIAILDATEQLDIATLKQAFDRRMRFLHEYIKPERKTYVPIKKNAAHFEEINSNSALPVKIADISQLAKRANADVVSALRGNGICILEVSL